MNENLPPMAHYTLSIEANTGYSATTEGECTPEQYGAAIAALAAQPGAVPDWSKFPGHLIDRYEGETITEELMQWAASELLAAAPTEAKPAQDAVDAERWPNKYREQPQRFGPYDEDDDISNLMGDGS